MFRVPRSEWVVAVCRWLLVAVVVGLEAAALSVWLALLAGAAPGSRETAVGVVVLAAALLVSQFLADLAVSGSAVGFPLGRTLGVALTETALWTGWLAAVAAVGGRRGAFVGGLAFAVGLAFQDTAEVDARRGAPPGTRLVDLGAVGSGLVTAAGGTVWLSLSTGLAAAGPLTGLAGGTGLAPATVGFVALVGALLVEHAVGVALARRERTQPTTASRQGRGSWT